MGFLTELVAGLRRDLDRHPLDDAGLLARAMASPPPRDFAAAIRAGTPAIVAEIKRASPSAGQIADRDPAMQARVYADAGAAAISVLTEPRHFHGSLADLSAARLAVAIPVLRKDFIVHPSQVIESRAAGADAVLLIADCLSPSELAALIAAAEDLGMSALVEAHDDGPLDAAIASGAGLIGVNARDLETLEVDREPALARLRRVPPDRVAVFESAVSTRSHVEMAVAAGASAVLVGEALMRADDPGALLRDLAGAGEASRR